MTNKKIKIDKTYVGYNCLPYTIAEAGVNHNGKLEIAKKMIIQAKKAGANAIKFQTFKAGEVTTYQNQMAQYQKRNTNANYKQIALLKKLELKDRFYPTLIKLSNKVGITFLSAPHGGFKSVDLLKKYQVPAFKFGSGDLTNLPVLKYAAKYKIPMIISTGMSTIKEIKEAINSIQSVGNKSIITLHATTNYPCVENEVNLHAMSAMMSKIETPVGYSDHTLGIQVPIMAATLGACLIEKHVTLDKNMSGPDHKASASFPEFAELCRQLSLIKKILGNKDKKPNPIELKMIPKIRKSIVTIRTIKKGEKFTQKNIAIKRPGTGLPPKYYNKIIKASAKKDLKPDMLITSKDYE